MAAPWLALLKNVPWIEVVRNATVVAESARKLWNTVRTQPSAKGAAAGPGQALTHDPQGLAGLQDRLATLERNLAELHEEMLASSALIKSLAEQNTQLVARMEASRLRTTWLLAATAASGLIAIVAVGLALSR